MLRAADIDECEENLHDCDESHRATCTDLDGSFECKCKTPNYTDTGVGGHMCRGTRIAKVKNASLVRFVLFANLNVNFAQM